MDRDTRLIGYGYSTIGRPSPVPTGDSSDNIIFVTDTKGWAGSGFERRRTTFRARRVWNDEDQTQIDVEIMTFYRSNTGKETSRTTSTCIALDVGQLDAFLEHLGKVPEPKQP